MKQLRDCPIWGDWSFARARKVIAVPCECATRAICTSQNRGKGRLGGTLGLAVWVWTKFTRAGISRLAKCRKFQAQNSELEGLRVRCSGQKYPRLFPSQTSYPLLQRKKARESSSLTQNAPDDCINPGIMSTGYFPGIKRREMGEANVSSLGHRDGRR
jgi:hypothetical protein